MGGEKHLAGNRGCSSGIRRLSRGSGVSVTGSIRGQRGRARAGGRAERGPPALPAPSSGRQPRAGAAGAPGGNAAPPRAAAPLRTGTRLRALSGKSCSVPAAPSAPSGVGSPRGSPGTPRAVPGEPPRNGARMLREGRRGRCRRRGWFKIYFLLLFISFRAKPVRDWFTLREDQSLP